MGFQGFHNRAWYECVVKSSLGCSSRERPRQIKDQRQGSEDEAEKIPRAVTDTGQIGLMPSERTAS
jgi:hypothetical protein